MVNNLQSACANVPRCCRGLVSLLVYRCRGLWIVHSKAFYASIGIISILGLWTQSSIWDYGIMKPIIFSTSASWWLKKSGVPSQMWSSIWWSWSLSKDGLRTDIQGIVGTFMYRNPSFFFKARSLNIHGLQQVFHGFPVIFSLLRERGLMICPLVTTIPPQSNQGKWPGRKWLASIASCVFQKAEGTLW